MRVSLFAQLVALATVVLAHEEHHIEYSRDELERRDFAMARRHLAARNCASSIDSFTSRRKAKRELKADKKPFEQQQQQQQGQGDKQPQHGRPNGPVRSSAISSASASSAAISSSSASSASASSAATSSAATSSVVISSSVTSASVASTSTVSTSTALAADQPAYYTTIQNSTCITAPETVEGPYYINDELVRTDLREDQTGVTLILDIGVIDINTCEPLSDAFVELWAANATGVYSSYTATLGGGGGSAPSNSSNATMSMLPSGSASGSASAVPSSMPSGSAGGSTGSMSSSPLVRNETFLRGGYPTNSQGVVELTTIYPGYYGGRTMHVHTMVHLNYGVNSNGTLASHTGSLIHIGQLFANESWNDAVYNTSPYTTDTNERTYNADDSIYATANAAGYNAEMDIVMLGSDISDGLLGYITIGVDSTATYSIANTNYLNSTSA